MEEGGCRGERGDKQFCKIQGERSERDGRKERRTSSANSTPSNSLM